MQNNERFSGLSLTIDDVTEMFNIILFLQFFIFLEIMWVFSPIFIPSDTFGVILFFRKVYSNTLMIL